MSNKRTAWPGYYAIIGFCCGVILGLSLSPVIEKSIGIILTLCTSLLALASGIKTKDAEAANGMSITPVPLALTLVGLLLGCFAGIFMRVNDVLSIKTEAAAVRTAPSKEKKDIAIAGAPASEVTGLHQDNQDECRILVPLHGEALRKELATLDNKTVDKSLLAHADSTGLEIFKSMLCH